MTATVIKSGAAVRHPRASAFSFGDLATQADRYMADVRAQAAKIIAEANRQADSIRARVAEQGRQDAVAAAEKLHDEKLGRQMATLLPALAKTVESVEQSKAAWLAHWEKNVVHLATRIAACVVRREQVAAPQITLTLLREALELAAGGGQLTIRLHPDDRAAIGPQAEKMAAEFGKLAAAELVADPNIAPGGCRIETQYGAIDQTFAAQLARIEEELAG
jgi:flagellar biosynthesis/type III secretory pathway protein FliH